MGANLFEQAMNHAVGFAPAQLAGSRHLVADDLGEVAQPFLAGPLRTQAAVGAPQPGAPQAVEELDLPGTDPPISFHAPSATRRPDHATLLRTELAGKPDGDQDSAHASHWH